VFQAVLLRGTPANAPIVPPAPEEGSGLAVFSLVTTPSGTNRDFNNPIIYWKDIEASENVFTWSSVDAAITAAANVGKKSILRLVPNWSSQLQASPNWLLSKPGIEVYSNGAFESPLPWSSVYQTEFASTVTAFGARYNSNPSVEAIQIPAGGRYGEIFMHTSPPGDMVAEYPAALEWVIDLFATHFPDKPLILMVNSIGNSIGENAAAYAVAAGYWLESNHYVAGNGLTRTILATHAFSTKILIEAEALSEPNAPYTEGEIMPEFEDAMDETFGMSEAVVGGGGLLLGECIDYVILDSASFGDSATAAYIPSGVRARLRV
jgi:hypothetical protein